MEKLPVNRCFSRSSNGSRKRDMAMAEAMAVLAGKFISTRMGTSANYQGFRNALHSWIQNNISLLLRNHQSLLRKGILYSEHW